MLLLDGSYILHIDDYNSFTYFSNSNLEKNKRYILILYNSNFTVRSCPTFPKNKNIIIFQKVFIPNIGKYNVYVIEYLYECNVIQCQPSYIEIINREMNEKIIHVFVKNSFTEIKMEKQNYTTFHEYKFEFTCNQLFHVSDDYILYLINEYNNVLNKICSKPINKSILVFKVIFDKFGDYNMKLFNKNNFKEIFHLQFNNKITQKPNSKIIHFDSGSDSDSD